jgi:hypothetical protein
MKNYVSVMMNLNLAHMGTSPVMTTLAALSLRLWNLVQVLYVAEPSNTFGIMARDGTRQVARRSVSLGQRGSNHGEGIEATQDDKRKEGTLKSGRSGRTVKSKKQAIAIGLSEARAKGKNVPAKKAS